MTLPMGRYKSHLRSRIAVFFEFHAVAASRLFLAAAALGRLAPRALRALDLQQVRKTFSELSKTTAVAPLTAKPRHTSATALVEGLYQMYSRCQGVGEAVSGVWVSWCLSGLVRECLPPDSWLVPRQTHSGGRHTE